MSDQPYGSVLRQVHQVVDLPDPDQLPDAALLSRFAERQDGAAFAALVRRHGPMVLSVCRRVLTDNHDADDAFQATFLVLMRKASTLRQPELLANWLYGVACRVARKARTVADRRSRSSEAVNDMPAPEATSDAEWRELRPLLDAELQHLPDKYRSPLVLHYLEGKTKDETARQLGCNEGTVSSRLARARDLLRGRLARHGLALTSAALGVILSEKAAPASLPADLLGSTLKLFSASLVEAGDVPASVTALAEGAMQTMHMSKWKIAAALLLTVSLAGAAFGASRLLGPPQAPEQAAETPKPPTVAVPADPEQAKGDRPALVKGNNAFALDLHARVGKGEAGNLLTSPYSVSTALAMTYGGARGTTADEMAKTLHFSLGADRLHPACGLLVRDLNGEGRKERNYQLSTANALWGQKNYGFREDFLALTESNYGAGLRLVDFMGAPDESRKTINAWVEKETKDKIKELLKPENVTPATRLILTNAIYLKAEWENKFIKDFTADGPFTVSADSPARKVPLMHQAETFGYLDGGSFQAVEMPYKGGDLSMVVLLPKKADGLAAFEKSLSADKLAEWLPKLKPHLVAVTLPRFKTESRFSLRSPLMEMGMTSAFDPNKADFSGMTTRDRLYISAVIHQTFINVDEQGTEAAGATAVIMGRETGKPPKPVLFTADHPFVYLIRDTRSGSILFLGRLVDPA